ncbi:unnamed protein product, partial [Adineta ricciae]
MMDSVDKVAKLIPKLKYQLLFLKEREKLFKANNSTSFSNVDLSSVIPKDLDSSSSSSDNLTMSDLSGLDIHDRTLTELQVQENIHSTFPAEYTIPQLPQSLLQDIEAGALHKFGPHHANRYPSHKQFDAIGTAIVNLLKLPFTKDNL